MKKLRQIILGLGYTAVVLLQPAVILAQQYSSSSYSVNEIIVGSGGINDFGSTNYSGRATIGEMAVGNITGTLYQAYAGFETTDEPYLEFVVDSTFVDLGVLSTGSTATTTATFNVRTYLASGYSVVTSGLPTSEAGLTIEPTASAAASTAGTEQFGINLVANTSPTSFGADPVQVPNGSVSFGQVGSGYNTANLYQYNEGDEIAYADSSSGETDFTISYIYNIKSVTEAGLYQLSHVLIATSTF